MGPIQSGVNQSLAVLSLASSQSPAAQELRKNRGEFDLGKSQEKAANKELNKEKKMTADTKIPLIDRDPDTGYTITQKKLSALEKQKDAAEKLGDYKTANNLKPRIEKGKEVLGRFDDRLTDRMLHKEDVKEVRELEEKGYTPEEIQMIQSTGTYPEDIQPTIQKAIQQAQSQVQQKKVRGNSIRLIKDSLVRKQNMREDAFNRKDIIRKKEDK